MSKSKPPEPQPRPTAGGSYLFNEETGGWDLRPAETSPAPLITEDQDDATV